MMPVIPPRSNKAPADYDRHLYRERHLVECFINKIKHCGRGFLQPLAGFCTDSRTSRRITVVYGVIVYA